MYPLKKEFDSNSTYFEYNMDSLGIPSIFIHGVGLDNTMWLPQKKFFHNKRIIFYDLYFPKNNSHQLQPLAHWKTSR